MHFQCDPSAAAQGTLAIQFSTQIGKGMFKTAHPGHLTLTHLAKEGLGTKPNEYVAVKHVYYTRHKQHKAEHAVTRYTAIDEHDKTIQEANLLYWASALFEFTYSFIEQFISDAPEAPPFPIPKLRFVRAAVTVSHHDVQGTTVGNTSSISHTFLLEEFINAPEEEFIKFVHNGGCHTTPGCL